MTTDNESKGGFGTYLIGLALAVPIMIYFGWATQKLWTWHLADRFGPLTLRQAVGADLVFGIIAAKIAPAEVKREPIELLKAIGRWLTWPLVALGISWAIRQFV